MKTTIKVTGGNSGNRTILNALNSSGFIKDLPFNNYSISYNSTSEAKACLRLAFMELQEDGAALITDSKMTYDASFAEIIIEDED